MANATTSPAHTAGPWRTDSLGEERIWILDEQSDYIAEIVTEDDCGFVCPKAQQNANARLIAAAPDGYDLALSMRNACKEHLSELNDQMVGGREGASEGELDDLQDQIDNWSILLEKCNAYFAKAEGRG